MMFVLALIIVLLIYEQNCRIEDDRILQKQIDNMKFHIDKVERNYYSNREDNE